MSFGNFNFSAPTTTTTASTGIPQAHNNNDDNNTIVPPQATTPVVTPQYQQSLYELQHRNNAAAATPTPFITHLQYYGRAEYSQSDAPQPQQQHHHHHAQYQHHDDHRQQPQQSIVAQSHLNSGETIAGARPNQKRRPRGGAKSHKVLDEPSFQNLFVARLPRALDNDGLSALFADFQPQSAVVMMNVDTGKSKGFGFVTFETEEMGKAAFERLNGRPLHTPSSVPTGDGMPSEITLEIKASTYNGQRIIVESQHVYFRNLPTALVDPAFSQLTHFFGQYGTVQRIEFHGSLAPADVDLTQPTTPALMVSFSTKEEAAAAIHGCHGKILFSHFGLTVPVMAKYADMTTVKSLDRASRRNSPPSLSGGIVSPSHRNSSRSSVSGGDDSVTSTAVTPAAISPHPFPSQHSLPPTGPSRIVPAQRNTSFGSFGRGSPSSQSPRAAGAVSSRGRSPLRGRSPPAETVQLQWTNSSEYNNNGAAAALATFPSAALSHSSSAEGSTAGSSRRSTVHQPIYRNDPYNQSGYVLVTSSSSNSAVDSSQVSTSQEEFEE